MTMKEEKSRDTILIKEISVDCIVGVYPDERKQEQPLKIDVSLGLDFSRIVKTGDLGTSCDYDRMTNEIIAFVKFRGFLLLEVAAEELAAMLLRIYTNLATVAVRIAKPNALKGRAEFAAVEIQRTRNDYPKQFLDTSFGAADLIVETSEAGLYLLHVRAGKMIPKHYHQSIRELEWLVHGELHCNDKKINGFAPTIWEREQVHSYENSSDATAILFSCDCPKFISGDRVIID